ncbi:MAG: glycosyltransferase [Streptosporangiales bacterium]|nr:glycosyltransferase [Streptosporangiales bacterium]
MRILHVNKFLYRRGGAETYLLDVANLQRRTGHEVAFFGMRHPDNPSHPFEDVFPAHVELDPPPRGAGARLGAAGRMIYSPSSRRGMEEVIRAFRPDVVHLHNIYHQLSPSVLRPVAESGIPAVMTLHDYKLACPSYLMLDHGRACAACVDGSLLNAVRRRCKDGSLSSSALLALESAIHRATDAYGAVQTFLCPSRFCADVMARAGIYPDRLRVLRNFVDVSVTRLKERPGDGLVYVGRLSPEKGVDTLLGAVTRLPTTTLDIVGAGPLEEVLRREAEDRAPGRVRFHGHLSRRDVMERIRASAVAVMPSRCHENQPMAVLEAFACGTPVVATERGGLPELVVPGHYGSVVPADDPDALADALRALLDDPDLAFAMGRAARGWAEEEFGPGAHLDRLDKVYESIRRIENSGDPGSPDE